MEGGARRGKPIKCRAAVCRGGEKPLVIEEVEVSAPIGYQVRVKIICTSVCHSDVTVWKMKEPPLGFFPRIFGHEAAGVVESVGEMVTEGKEGDMVVPVFLANCVGCRSEKGNICSALPFKATPKSESVRGGGTVFRDAKGEKINIFLNVSSFSEYTVVDVGNVGKIDANIPLDKACLLSCHVSTGVSSNPDVVITEDDEQISKIILFDDISEYLFSLGSEEAKYSLVFHFIDFFRYKISGKYVSHGPSCYFDITS